MTAAEARKLTNEASESIDEARFWKVISDIHTLIDQRSREAAGFLKFFAADALYEDVTNEKFIKFWNYIITTLRKEGFSVQFASGPKCAQISILISW